ncbi:MAG: type II toxin-antitoxin system VapC family toxin [Candidatus Kapabacteria bacterium]|nr:type II toxin-antitoxin system VapC family toxin [Candidatus Kapabacteria bacterium]
MYLLDTSLLINATNNPDKISSSIQLILNDSKNSLYISSISFWEITIKQSIGKLKLNEPIEKIFNDLNLKGVNIIQIQINHLNVLSKLPHFHKDPFDRLLISQAIAENLTIITSDSKFELYPVKVKLN